MNKFLERLKELIKENEISYEELAIQTNIGTPAMYAWSGNYNMPKLNNIILLSNYFKCSIEYLIGRSDDNSELPPKECLPFHIQLENILKQRKLNITHLRNSGVISAGLSESIFTLHSSPHMENVIKIADYLKISIDELVGRV